jgi:hypothetical protein
MNTIYTYIKMNISIRKPLNGFHKSKFGWRIIALYPKKKKLQKNNQRGVQTNTLYQSYSWIGDNKNNNAS